MVTAVDPYSGAFASANSMQSFESEDMEYQQLTIQSIAGDGFGRGEFELVDGATALRLVVSNAPTPDPESAKGFALEATTARGWEYTQFSCLVKLWERESNWRLTATNSHCLLLRWHQPVRTGEPMPKLRSSGAWVTSKVAMAHPVPPLLIPTITTGTDGRSQTSSKCC
jgi:hypothetical protein